VLAFKRLISLIYDKKVLPLRKLVVYAVIAYWRYRERLLKLSFLSNSGEIFIFSMNKVKVILLIAPIFAKMHL
tara:strand:- start:2326 stop:2544 length:219 start_codon:yes stop_codon:yes gene_type:complete